MSLREKEIPAMGVILTIIAFGIMLGIVGYGFYMQDRVIRERYGYGNDTRAGAGDRPQADR
jgi:hypothetical protein